jgi:hypothetical protein
MLGEVGRKEGEGPFHKIGMAPVQQVGREGGGEGGRVAAVEEG